MNHSTYSPLYWEEFRSDMVSAKGYSLTGTATQESSTSFDFQIPDDMFIRTIGFLFKNADFGDYVKVQVIDLDGIISPPGTVLKTQIDAWYITDTGAAPLKFSPLCPNKILQGLYLRFIYTSTSASDVTVAINMETIICLV